MCKGVHVLAREHGCFGGETDYAGFVAWVLLSFVWVCKHSYRFFLDLYMEVNSCDAWPCLLIAKLKEYDCEKVKSGQILNVCLWLDLNGPHLQLHKSKRRK